MSSKRERGSNFTREETDLLIKLVSENKHVLENKKSDAVTWAEKERCWQVLEAQFNSTSSIVFRSAKALKIKYDGIKRDTRKKSAVIRSETYRTGGGPSTAPALTPSEEKVKNMILLSVEGMDSVFDSDHIPETVSPLPEVAPNIPPIQFLNLTQDAECTTEIDSPNTAVRIAYEDCIQMSFPQTPKSTISCDNQQKRKVEDVDFESDNKMWSHWKPSSLRSKKHPALCKPKPKRPFEKVAESKIELADIQKKILHEELENKRKQWLFEEEERQHKREMWALEKEILQNKLNKLL